MVWRFNLRQFFGLLIPVLAVLALAKNENASLAIGTFVCIAGWIAVGKLTHFLTKNFFGLAFGRRNSGQTVPRSHILLMFTTFALTLSFVLFAISQVIREESSGLTGPMVAFAWLLAPLVLVRGLILDRMKQQPALSSKPPELSPKGQDSFEPADGIE